MQITAQWVDDVVVELRQLMQTGWCGLAALQSLQSSARQRGDQAYAAVVTTLLDAVRAELHLGPTAVCPDSWAETHEGKLFAFYVQLQGGTEASSSTAARLIPISTTESDDDCMSLVQHFKMAEDPSVANAFKVTSTEDDAYGLGGDVISLVTHGVKKQWLKPEARRRRSRRRAPPWTGRGNRGRGALPRHVPREPPHPPRETRETLNLGQCAADKQQHRREREEAKAKTDRTGPKAVAKKMPKPAAASSSSKEPASTVTQTALGDDGEPVPLTMEDAVQLWLLWLGVNGHRPGA